LTQSLAILRYLGRKYKLEGATEVEKNRIALLEQEIVDLFQNAVQFVIAHAKVSPTESEKDDFVKKLESELQLVDTFLGSKVKWASGGYQLSYVDFWLYEYLHWLDTNRLFGGVVQKYANLKQFLVRFESLPQISTYLKEVNARETPF